MRELAVIILIALLLFSCATSESPEVPSFPAEAEEAVEIPLEEEEEAPAEEEPPGEKESPEEEAPYEESPALEEEEPMAEEEEPPEEEEETVEESAEKAPELEARSKAEELESLLFSGLAAFSLESEEDGGGTIAFSGGNSSMVLRDGKEHVSLTGGASVQIDSLVIEADEIELSGSSWRFVECSGNARVLDEERGISIRTSSIWYDREEERLLVTSWYEIEDRKNEVAASGAVLEYRMKEERLQLDKDVLLLRASEDSLMRCRAQSVMFSRGENRLVLSGSATVSWKGNSYKAEVIAVDLDTDTIMLEGRIQGDING